MPALHIPEDSNAADLKALLAEVTSKPGVVGGVIVGHDGVLLAENLPPGDDVELFSGFALGIFINTCNTALKMRVNQVHQMMCLTDRGSIVIVDFGGGLLVTINELYAPAP